MLSFVEKLLVYIPTYNRPELLKSQLDSLLPQVERLSEHVRLIVADNASESMLHEEYLRNLGAHQNINFIRRPHNIQGNANIMLGFTFLEPGEYLWILSDDTKVTATAVETILRATELKPDLIGLSQQVKESELEVMRWTRGALSEITDHYSWGLISSAIYSSHFFLPHSHQAFFFHNSSFPHLGVLLSAFSAEGTMSVAWLSEQDIHGENVGIGATNYSMAIAGFPHLFVLTEGRERKRLVRQWLLRYSAGFAYYQASQPLSSLTTKALIWDSGLVARALYYQGQAEVWLRKTKLGGYLERLVESSPKLLALVSKSDRLMFRR